ncbi:MAG: Peptidyl-tRNA hydrolase [Pelotomaculum thermopropionicum]|uniref:Peptidyl-tRNA hydrolase n=1 Tax=Pelotomaculum thermopropionicum TaxID=110500 RepID=A0A101HQN2_9FIRM|nr:MAG: Peptidyl-tRNA hydrolase [Pelotomaculum thermopropionicum]
MKLIVGLGNPGCKYAATRHNVGFMALDRLAADAGVEIKKKMFKSLAGRGMIGRENVILAKPQTFMNLSGEAVGLLLGWFKLNPADLIVVYDDLDLPPGNMRVRSGGGSGGHKGMQSIIKVLGTQNFPRIRIGIGRPPVIGFETADYVLSRFSPGEVKKFEEVLEMAAKAVRCIVLDGVERAMNLYNSARVLQERTGDRQNNGENED